MPTRTPQHIMAKQSSIKVGAVQTHLENVLLPMGLNLTSVDLMGKGLNVETHPFAISLDHKGHFVARLKSGDLASFLTAKAPGGFKNFRVTAANGELLIQASVTIIVEVPIKANCTLRIHNHTEIHVDLSAVEAIGSGVKKLLQPQLEKINPVLDASDFPFDSVFEKISIDDEHVVVEGKMWPRPD